MLFEKRCQVTVAGSDGGGVAVPRKKALPPDEVWLMPNGVGREETALRRSRSDRGARPS